MMHMEQNENIIDFSRIIDAAQKNIVGIIIWGVVGLAVSLMVSFFVMTPKYNSTVDILVNQKNNNSAVQFNVQQADLQAINTYKDVLKKSVILTPVLKTIKEKDNYQGNLEKLQESIKITNQTNSQVISVTVTDTNAYVAADIANTMGTVFTREIKKMMKVDNVTVVNKAVVNTNPVSPRKKLNAFLGLVIGLFIGTAIVIIKELRDTTVGDQKFLTEDLGLVNLGSIYHIKNENKQYQIVETIESDDFDDKDHAPKRV